MTRIGCIMLSLNLWNTVPTSCLSNRFSLFASLSCPRNSCPRATILTPDSIFQDFHRVPDFQRNSHLTILVGNSWDEMQFLLCALCALQFMIFFSQSYFHTIMLVKALCAVPFNYYAVDHPQYQLDYRNGEVTFQTF